MRDPWSRPLTLLILAAAPTAAHAQFINELHYDNQGTDSGELIEIAGPAGLDLAGHQLVLYNGNNGAAYNTRTLSGVLPDQVEGHGALAFTYPENGIQNGAPDGIALVRPDGTVAQFLSYEGTLTAVDGPAAGMTSTDIGALEDGSQPAGQSLQLTGESIEALAWTGPATASPGMINVGQLGEDPGDPGDPGEPQPATIAGVQGSGAESPLAGTRVKVSGVVTASYVGDASTLGGFYMESATDARDADPQTSEGIFVYVGDGATSPAIGEAVEVVGVAEEYFGQTQLNATAGTVTVSGSGGALPSPVAISALPAQSEAAYAAAFEPLEGMRVTLANTWTVTETYNLHTYGELKLVPGDQPLQAATNVMEPGAAAGAFEDAVVDNTVWLTLDDGRDANLSAPPMRPVPYVSEDAAHTIRRGSKTQDLQAVLGYGFDLYRLQPVGGPDAVQFQYAPRPGLPDVRGNLRIAGFNVLNYFNGDGSGGGFPTSRGAHSPAELARQTAKIVAALSQLDADALGLTEIENDADTARPAIDDLVAALNAAVGGRRTYAAVQTGRTGGDVIRVAWIYDTKTLRLDGFEVLDDVDPYTRNTRPPVAARYTHLSSGQSFVGIMNHLKSKGSGSGANADQNDGQGASNADRVLAVNELVAWIGSHPFFQADEPLLLLGDFNAYANEDPIDALKAADFVDLEEQLAQPGAREGYSYEFRGTEGRLDYVFANDAALELVNAAAPWHINADEPRSKDYNDDVATPCTEAQGCYSEEASFGNLNQPDLYAADPYRSSDHDPVLVGLDLDDGAVEPRTCFGLTPTIVGTPGADFLTGTPGPDVILGLGGADRIDGRGGDDVICGGAGADDILGGAGSDRIRGGRGDDVVRGGAGRDDLRGNRGVDALTGDAGDDLLLGGADDDLVSGGPGADSLRGGAGDDAVEGEAGADILRGGRGDDDLTGGPGRDFCLGGESLTGCEN